MNDPLHTAAPPHPTYLTLLRMTRPGFLLITFVACILGFASAAACGCGFDWVLAGCTLILALIAHAGANVLNDYHDALNGADAANPHGIYPFTGGSRHIQNGQATSAQTRQFAWTLLIVVMLFGLLLSAHSGPGLLFIGAAGLVLGWAYSSPPLMLMSRGLGEVAVGLSWWLVVLGANYVQRKQFHIVPAVTAVSFALLVVNILVINGVPDAQADVSVGKRTLVTRTGPTGACLLYLGIAVFAHLWLYVSALQLITPMPALWGLLSAPLSLASASLFWARRHHPNQLRTPIVLTITAASVHGLAIAAGLASLTRN
jgi:1,4-dihydroxy-2-naphthoate polyprenyltransferase